MATMSPLPAPVPTSALVEGGLNVAKKINFMREFDALMCDAKLLRDFSVSKEKGNVRIPKVFLESAKLRIQLMQMWLVALPILYNAERSQELYAAVIDSISDCAPETAKKILITMKAARERLGFVSDASAAG